MTKRILALVLVAIFALTSTMLVACDNGEATSEDKAPVSSPAQGGDESSKEVEPSTPVEPTVPDEPTVPSEPTVPDEPSEDIVEPEKFTNEWVEWLVEDYGDTYTMAWSGSLYGGIKYDDTMDPSCWELWPYTDKQIADNSHFHACICISSAEFDGFSNLGTEEYEWTWKVFYKVDGSDEEYKSFEGTPWGAITFGENYLYRFDMFTYGAEFSLDADGNAQTYHVVMVILDAEGNVEIWRDELIDWTNSSQAYYDDAVKHGIIKVD
ncbi:MAG: hypothetical protein IJY89_03320 [Clostridia bacterium]|nr:hypothetical protein [Clostridia bacterium]